MTQSKEEKNIYIIILLSNKTRHGALLQENNQLHDGGV